MAGTDNAQQVKIKQTTKLRLDMLKGGKTYDQIISEMTGYFEQTGISPQSNVISPSVAVKAQADRVIEVVRGIEKTEKVILKSILDTVKFIAKSQAGEGLPADFNPDEYLHINQVQELLSEAEQLKKDNAKKNDELARLKSKLEMTEATPAKESGSGVSDKVKKSLLELVGVFEERKKPSTFNEEIYEFDRNTFDQWIEDLSLILKSYDVCLREYTRRKM